MTTLFMLIGPPGVGKTHYCSQRMGEDDVRVSMDDLQQMMGGDRYGNYRHELKNVYRRSEEFIIKEALGWNNVWLDRTNMDRLRRAHYIRAAQDLLVKDIVAINFMAFRPPNDGWLLHRRMQYDRGVSESRWKEVIDQMLHAYDTPSLAEGFSSIIDVTMEEVTE